MTQSLPALAYDLYFKDTLCGTSWARLEEKPRSKTIVIECFQRMNDIEAIGLRKFRKHSVYRLTRDGVFKSARIKDSFGNEVSFDASDILARGRIDLVLERNQTPLLALYLKRFLGTEDGTYQALIPETGQVISYRLTASGRALESSLGERLVLDGNGVIKEVVFKPSEFTVRRCKRPLPRWQPFKKSPGTSYAPPQDLISKDIVLLDVEASCVRPRPPSKSFAAGVFIGGTGVYTRHGFTAQFDIGYHQLLDGLAHRGLASVRYEKFDRKAANLAQAEERQDFASLRKGAESWLDWLNDQPWARKLPRIVIGHSLGGLVALSLAARHKDIDAVIIMSTPGQSFRQIITSQRDWFLRHLPFSKRSKAELTRLQERLIATLEEDRPWALAELDPQLQPLKRKLRLYRSVLDLDPLALVSKGTCPLLIVQGGKDVQVEPKDAERLMGAARAAGRPARLILDSELDHLLKKSNAQGIQAISLYGDKRRRVPASLIRLIAQSAQTLLGR